MDCTAYLDGNISHLLDTRLIGVRHDVNHSMQMHSSLIRKLSQERELEGHTGCVNAVAWNSRGSLLISGSDDTQVNIWSYSTSKLLHAIDSGHTGNIFCTKFMPETSDELVVSGAGDAKVRLFNLSRTSESGPDDNASPPSALFGCHTRRVKKLAVEVGNPNVVWSASEDGIVRQHDIREGSSCPPAGSSHQECRNVLLDLRCGAKRSLTDPPKHSLALKSCDISTTRPHLLLVGGRRMLSPLTSSRRRISPPPWVNYFCPVHLSDRRRSSLYLSHVTFSPNGEEVLISYSGEHVYPMNVDRGSESSVQYSVGDASKIMIFTPIPIRVASQLPAPDAIQDNLHTKISIAARLDKCRKLLQIAEKSLKEGNNCYYAIEACNEILDGRGCEIGPELQHECLCTRAALLLKRKWKNDAHMAIRDCNNARGINDSSFRALYCMSEALSQLGKHKEALDFAFAAQCLAPSNSQVTEAVENIKRHLVAAESGKNSKAKDRAPRSESRTGRMLSLRNIFYRSEANSDGSQNGPRSEREDSDYDDEMELDFETLLSSDEGRDDVDSDFLHESLNLRIHPRGDSDRATGCFNGSSEAPSSSSQNDRTSYQPEAVIDMKQRYVGHCNIGTDIKQASFVGQKGEFVASGSDDGRWFIWEKRTGRLIKMLLGDEAVENCVQCHPFDSVVATSGIDNTIKIWTPSASVPSVMAGGATGPETTNMLDAMESNCPLNWFGCMNLLKELCVHLSVLRVNYSSLEHAVFVPSLIF